MAKIILFSGLKFSGNSKQFMSNDPNLVINGDDFIFSSAIVISGAWSLYPDVNNSGDSLSLDTEGGPNMDGTYEDYADWQQTAEFHVKSIDFSE